MVKTKHAVGEKVKIKAVEELKKTECYNPSGKMDGWAGQTMTIAAAYPETPFEDSYLMNEDKGEWYWYDDMIIEKIN
jgi:hypothetical protein